MGIAPLYCCFLDKSPNCMVLTGLMASFVAFAFLVWGLADLWFKKDGVLAIYIITFVFVCISLVGFVLLFVFINLRKSEYTRCFYTLGKIICVIIFIICIIAFIFLLVAFIILIVDYAKMEKDIPGQFFPNHEWAAVFVPSIIALVCLVFMILAANILYKLFDDYLLANPIPAEISQNTVVSTISNQPQPIMQPAIQPVVPVAQPVVQPIVQPVVQPIVQPIVQPVVQHVVQPVVQPVVQSVMQPVVEPVMQSAVLNEKPPFIGPVEEDYANNGPFPPKINYSAYPASVKESGINYNF